MNDQGAKKIKKDVPPRPYSLRDHIQGEMTGEFENRKGEPDLPKHHTLDVLENDDFYEVVLSKSFRIDGCVIGNKLYDKLPKLGVTVHESYEDGLDSCLYTPMLGISLAQFRKDSTCIKYLCTTRLKCCYGVIFWDNVKQKACMGHFLYDDTAQESFDIMLSSMSDSSFTDLRMFIIGGFSMRMTYKNGYFKFIEKYAASKNIEILQTFLGNNGERPTDIIFDVESGELFELIVKENYANYNLDIDCAYDDRHGKEVLFNNFNGRRSKYRLADEKTKNLIIPVSVNLIV